MFPQPKTQIPAFGVFLEYDFVLNVLFLFLKLLVFFFFLNHGQINKIDHLSHLLVYRTCVFIMHIVAQSPGLFHPAKLKLHPLNNSHSSLILDLYNPPFYFPTFCFMSLTTLESAIGQYLYFCDWLISRSLMSSCFNHSVANDKISFFF